MTVERLAFTVREAAEAIGVHRSTIYKLIRNREVRAAVVGGKTVIPMRELERLLDREAVAS